MADHAALPIAARLKDIRKARGLSLSALATKVGVSKAMLGQIEREESSPTLNTLWKISRGLKIPLSQLIGAPGFENQKLNEIVHHANQTSNAPDVSAMDSMEVKTLYAFDPTLGYEMYELTLPVGYDRQSEPHYHGVIEQITVLSSALTLHVKDEVFKIVPGQSFRFRADCPHRYVNETDQATSFLLIHHYPHGRDPREDGT